MDGVSGPVNFIYLHAEVTLCVELHQGVRGKDKELTLQFPVLFILLLAKDTD
jgi:hypothetical protein